MSSVRLEAVSFAYADAVPLLETVDLRLPAGWTGLVGQNGAGKTTLLALLAGALVPGSGRISFDPEDATAILCPQRVEAPGAPEEELARRGDGAAHRLRGELALEPAALRRWNTLSPGERKRWQVGGALAAEPEVLLLDEPTNHVDAAGRALLLRALARFRGVGVLVSHDRGLLEALAPRTARLQAGRVRLLDLPYGEARRTWEAEAREAWERRSAAQEEARRAAERLDEARRAREAAARAQSGRDRDPKDRDARTLGAKTRRAWAEARLGRDVGRLRGAAARAEEEVPPPPDELATAPVFAGWERAARPVLLALEAPSLRAGPAELLREVRVRLGREDRIWIRGANGAGKSTLLGALVAASTLPPDRLLHVPQELPAAAARALLGELRALAPGARGRVLAAVAALGSDPGRLLASDDPSPGEARKLLLALGLGRHAWALVLDEPTNHLDLPGVERLEAALRAYPGALLLVTHDEGLAERCTTSRWELGGGLLLAS